MDLLVVATAGCFMLMAVGFGLVLARLISRNRILLTGDESDPICSPMRYRPIERLLAEADQKILASLGDRNKERLARKVRAKIFRGYTKQLSEDLNQISQAIKAIMVTSPVDRPDLAGFLMKQQLIFAFSMMWAEVKLLLYESGWSGIDVRRLRESVDTLCAQLGSLTAIAEPSVE